MKKMINIMLIVALLATLCACGKKKEDHPITKKELEELLIGETEEENVEDAEPEQFWLNTHSGTKKPFTGTLFGGQTVPVNLEGEDFNERNQPFSWPGSDGQTYDNIDEVLHNDEEVYSYWEDADGHCAAEIMTRTRFDGEKQHDYIRESDSFDIYLLNFSQEDIDPSSEDSLVYEYEPKAASECFAQNWWYLKGSTDALDLSFDPPEKDYCQDTQMEALWDRLGAPDYVAAEEAGPLRAALEANSGSLKYDLVYEYDDFVLAVGINETINGPGRHLLLMQDMRYYTPESWEQVQTEMELLDFSVLMSKG